MMRKLLAALLLSLAPAAAAQTPAVDAARAAGSVGERYDGYLGVAGPVPAAVRSQVASINIRRRALYSNLAAARGVSPAPVDDGSTATMIDASAPKSSQPRTIGDTRLELGRRTRGGIEDRIAEHRLRPEFMLSAR